MTAPSKMAQLGAAAIREAYELRNVWMPRAKQQQKDDELEDDEEEEEPPEQARQLTRALFVQCGSVVVWRCGRASCAAADSG